MRFSTRTAPTPQRLPQSLLVGFARMDMSKGVAISGLFDDRKCFRSSFGDLSSNLLAYRHPYFPRDLTTPGSYSSCAVLFVNAGELLQRLAGAKVQQGCKQKGPRYRGPFCLARFFLGGGALWWRVRDGGLDLCLA